MDANPLSAPVKRCLHQKESLECLRQEGFYVQANYPKSSQDLNAIENVWSHLRDKLEITGGTYPRPRNPLPGSGARGRGCEGEGNSLAASGERCA